MFICTLFDCLFIVIIIIINISLQSISLLQIKIFAERYKALRLTDEEVNEM